ncbi:Ada metal-binding domain-containing protein [soil metagenome]
MQIDWASTAAELDLYTLIGTDGTPYPSLTPGRVGGHRRTRIYGRLDCPSALRAIARGGYAAQRVFFADEVAARAAGYRPCARCLPVDYREWRLRTMTLSTRWPD